ncbi:aminoacyl-tRNA deacylase [Promicromonospora iranensis]|jgi:prolyl-tRNA editing enzyme YbaK/EbsC (Cys-tRNA(Pro) deacylase)|uniref:aminoacyl-tRNA deacylase n=1 Tax=Promicromonospora iranensis TaxID=1105144 RepID=UPI0023AA0941|nr:YbaK/EbsC family protein [Promicromonospora iranensis]
MSDAGRVTDGTERFEADAVARGLDVEIVEHLEAQNLAELADLLSVQPGEIVKSLVVKRHDGNFLFALVPGGRQISWPKLRAVVGVNKLRMSDDEMAHDATGYRRGVTPIGSTTAWPVVADERIVGRRIAVGAGTAGRIAFVDADALVAAYGATVTDISAEESPH